MARTKAEIRAFLDSKVGTIVPHPAPYQDLGGQCVTLIEALLEFLGAPNPYAARGNAISVNDTLLRQGIAQPGKGWLTIVVNRDMGYIGGVHYGHIWADLQGEANYESNGNRALYTTKNTRPLSQGQQFVNLDQYVKGDDMKADINMVKQMAQTVGGRLGFGGRADWNGSDLPAHVGTDAGQEFNNWYWSKEGQTYRDQWLPAVVNFWATYKDVIGDLQARPTRAQLEELGRQLAEKSKEVEVAGQKLSEAQKQTKALEDEKKADQETGNSFLRWLGNLLRGGK